MAYSCGFTKLLFLLLMLVRIPLNETRPLRGNSPSNSELISGNEFLKLFVQHEELEKDYTSTEFRGDGSDGAKRGNVAMENRRLPNTKQDALFDKKSAETGRRLSGGRSLAGNRSKLNQYVEDSKEVVKLVTSGSKIVFLEDYDENDAVLDAEARDIDLKKEVFKEKNHTNLDDYKVVAVSVSSSSQRGTITAKNRFANTASPAKYERRPPAINTKTTTIKPFVAMVPKSSTPTTNRSQALLRSKSTKVENTAGGNFINRSHKSEFSIEEVEPLTMSQRHRKYQSTSVDTLGNLDSDNSASTNIHKVLAAPLQPSASASSMSMVTTAYHSDQRNMTINRDSSLHVSQQRHKTAASDSTNEQLDSENLHQQYPATSDGDSLLEDQLLPFQTVIYHDTKAGHGPQSRSISYSSISQNVEDLKKWQQSGILAEARRNVSESLKPMQRYNTSSSNHQAEPARFYSQPSKMYSEPSKFYSEPAKVYSEPSRVYGEPEKFYSEPAKVYGEPSKFYSEPSKVYSQPAKVYSEPAKTYWPILAGTTTSTENPSTTMPTTTAASITTTSQMPSSVNILKSSKKPAIVSRIAFGEANLFSSTTSTISSTTAAPLTTSRPYASHAQHQYSRTYSSHRNPSSSASLNKENSPLSSSSSSQSSSSTPSRRILFNLDRLPYDLLNAPEPTVQQQQLLELQKTKKPQQTVTHQPIHQHEKTLQHQNQRHHINPCLESAVSSLFSSSTLSAHPALLKQRSNQQQHSNQNVKGLPNEADLVKCVAAISHSTSDDAAVDVGSDNAGVSVEMYTTERNHIEDIFTPASQQSYEIEEPINVTGNGRSHISEPHSNGGRNSFVHPTTSPVHQQQHGAFKPNRQRTHIHFGTKVINPTEAYDAGHQHQINLSQITYNSNANANIDTSSNQRHHNAPDYQQYDDAEQNGNGDGDNEGAVKHNDYDDGSSGTKGENGQTNDDDAKVAYIVEGQNYRKYRVEEETDDGFIVGEYGVVDHNDGNLRGVRYTADSTINRSLIQKALLTFLKLK